MRFISHTQQISFFQISAKRMYVVHVISILNKKELNGIGTYHFGVLYIHISMLPFRFQRQICFSLGAFVLTVLTYRVKKIQFKAIP